MLGKRLWRTTSMSQLSPARTDHAAPEKSDKKAQGMQEHIADCCMLPEAAGIQNERRDDADCGRGYGAIMEHEFNPSHMLPDCIFTESPAACEGNEELFIEAHDEEASPSLQLHMPSPLVPYQMGFWTHHHITYVPHVGPSMRAEAGICRVDFLDVCFYCKRRLRHERDIFIYRGDSAFCSEECRHRQILSDERRARRGNKRGGARATSETAVAA